MFSAAVTQIAKLLQTNNQIIYLQIRNTFILKRKFMPPIPKIYGRLKRFRRNHYCYELVLNTDSVEPPDMKVILTTFLEGYGNRGDIVSVQPHVARMNLLLPGLAVYLTPENVAKFQKERESGTLSEGIPGSHHVIKTRKYLANHVFPVDMNIEEPWVIEPWHIRIAFHRMGFVLPESVIELPEQPITGPDPEKESKEFVIFITVNKSKRIPVRCRIHHWSNDPLKMTPITPDWYMKPAAPLFDEQAELLSKMPSPEPPEL